MSGKLEGVCAVATCTCTASYSVKSSDKSTKAVSVQEANVIATVNGMQSYLELPICEGEEKDNVSSTHQGQEPIDHYEFCRRNSSI